MEPSDEQLMQWYRDGDPDAFDRLYQRYRGPLYRYVRRLCNGCDAADELYQDTWLRVIRGRRQWQPGRGFRPWLYRIAHNRVVDHWRANLVKPGEPSELEQELEVVDRAPWLDVMAHLRDCIERLKALLEQLPVSQRDAFLLKEEAGLSLDQIAEATDTGRETVKSRLRYAVGSLRRGLEGCDE